jgi:glutamate dehydrogenase/leucine dehydrogenase
MLRNSSVSLEFRGPFREGDCDIWEAEGVSSHGEEHAYSCIALCRKNWRAGCPALGGTRWVESHANEDSEVGKHEARHQAIELALSMYVKNTLLRKVAHSLNGRGSDLFNWQGGKGVIWTPPGVKKLSEHRLRCHGRLIDHLRGEYYGSKDAGIGTPQLQVIAAETSFTIGRDTGEGTAHGVHSGLKQVLREGGAEWVAHSEHPLRGMAILVLGAGKVGLPLIGLLHSSGAKVYVYDDHLDSTPEALEKWCQFQIERGAALGESHRRILFELHAAGRIFAHDQEEEALSQADIQIVSPNGGPTEWLSREVSQGRTRASILVESKRRNGNLRLILGAGNDQVSMTDKTDRERVLASLDEAGITFIPDPVVSPGGVIAVSHERSTEWLAERVNEDAERIVSKGVEQVFREARQRYGRTGSIEIYRAFESMINGELA